MENASKFLYMAAGILISLMVLMLMVFLFIRGSYLTAEYDIKISDEELKAYNSKFEAYATKENNVLAADIVTLVNKAREINNKEINQDFFRIIIKINGSEYEYNKEITDYTILAKKGREELTTKEFLKTYSNEDNGTKKLFKCTSIEYSKSGKVNFLKFEEQ